MTHTYLHTFKNGRTIKLEVDFSGPALKMKSTHVPPGCQAEYLQWRMTVVMLDVYNRMTPEQCRNAAQVGKSKLTP